MRTRAASMLGIAIILVLTIPPQFAQAAKTVQASYLIGLRSNASTAALARAGYTVQQVWPSLKSAEVRANAATLARLRANPAVTYVEQDQLISAASTGTSATSTGQATWGLGAIMAPAAWSQGSTGQGIKVCDLDTGIDYSHPAFQGGVIKGSKNFVNDGHPTAADGDGHGTYTAGEIAARLNQTAVFGAAYGVQLYAARVLGDDGSGTLGALVNGVNWCVNTVHARILNMSFGDNHSSRTLQQLLASVYSKGVLTFAASGNDGQKGISYPARYSSVIAVGAIDSSDALAGFSNYGPKQELVAPGVNVLSSVPVGTGLQVSATENGTSYAPHAVKYATTGTVSGPMVDCGLAASPTSCAGKPASGSWIALITRGGTTFANKLKDVMTQGASAAIITNNDASNPNDAGSFTLGAEGNWIPAVSVSYSNGSAMRSAGAGTGTVAVTPWDYSYADGTSAASPYAAGVAALAWSANPKLSNKQVRTILQKSAKDLGPAGRDQKFGYGLVQATTAVQLAKSTQPNANRQA